MRRPAGPALLAAALLAATPVVARLCEAHCQAAASHCHEAPESGKGPNGCPDKSHGAETASLSAGKAALPSGAALAGSALARLAPLTGFSGRTPTALDSFCFHDLAPPPRLRL